MIWAIYIDENTITIDGMEHKYISNVQLLDDKTLELRNTSKDAVLAGLRAGAIIENIVNDCGKLTPVADQLCMSKGSRFRVNNPYTSNETFLLKLSENSTAIMYNKNTKRLETKTLDADELARVKKYYSVVRQSDSPLVLEYEQSLNTGLARKITLKQNVIGGNIKTVKDGDDIVFVGGMSGPINDTNEDVIIPDGVTAIQGGCIKNAKSIKFPSTIRKFLYGGSISGGQIIDIPTTVDWSEGRKSYITGLLAETNETPFIVPKVNNWEPTEGYLKNITNRKAVYAEENTNWTYKDRLLSNSFFIEAVALMAREKMVIGVGQFSHMGDLTHIITPNGKIVAVLEEGLYYCSSLGSIDLSECVFLGKNALANIYSRMGSSGELMSSLATTGLLLRFNKSLKAEYNAFGGNIARVEFYGDDIELEDNAFNCDKNITVGYRTQKVKKKLMEYKENNTDWNGRSHMTIVKLD